MGRVAGYVRKLRNADLSPRPVGYTLYFFCCIKMEVVNAEAAERAGDALLACAHLGDLEAPCLGAVLRRKVD